MSITNNTYIVARCIAQGFFERANIFDFSALPESDFDVVTILIDEDKEEAYARLDALPAHIIDVKLARNITRIANGPASKFGKLWFPPEMESAMLEPFKRNADKLEALIISEATVVHS